MAASGLHKIAAAWLLQFSVFSLQSSVFSLQSSVFSLQSSVFDHEVFIVAHGAQLGGEQGMAVDAAGLGGVE